MAASKRKRGTGGIAAEQGASKPHALSGDDNVQQDAETELAGQTASNGERQPDRILLSLFAHRFMAVAEVKQ